MYSLISTNSKQALVWALMFTLVLSVFPTTVADPADDEWFYDIYETVTDEDGDGYNDTVDIGYDPDTTCDCNITVEVDIYIYDEDGDYVDSVYADHTIYNGYGDSFMQDWTPDYSGTFDFDVYLWDEWGNYEDYWNVTGVDLEPLSGTDETINVDNGLFNEDDDSLMNDLAFWAHARSNGEDYVNITVWKKNAIGQWDYYDDGSTDDEGYLTFKNVTGGEYLWDAYHDGNHLSEEGGYAVVDNIYTTGHVGVLQDRDNADDWDDFMVQIPEGNGTSDEGYVEIYDDSGDLVDSGKTNESEGDGWYVFVSYDLEKGNYTHYIYEEEDGDLLQNGSFYSYGSTSTNYDEWFEDWSYQTNDTNGDGVANSIITKYDPNTECNCTVDIEVDFSAYNNDTGEWDGGDYYGYEINGTEVDSFETDEWSPSKNGNYTFEFYLYDENWNYEDHFNFTVYLECDDNSNDSDCDNDEWFEDWDYDTESTDDDNLDDTINVDYDPDTDCDCEVNVYVYMDVYENASGNLVDYGDSQYHEINGTEEEYFTHSWTSRNSTSYDFNVYMYDDNWNYEDEFWVYNVFLYAKSGAGGPGDDDEWFDWIDAYTYDNDDDGYDDTAELDYDPDTTCECDINITLYIDIYDNETGYWVNGTEEDYTIYSDDDDYWYQEWSPEYNGTFDFYVELYDEDGNLEDEEEYMNVSLHTRSSGGGGDGDDDEWFWGWDYDVDPSDTITIGYDPDTECECYVNITVYVDVYDNVTGDGVDWTYDEHTIYNEEGDWFEQDWTASNDGTYDFWVNMYDGDGNEEDDFWIYNVSLESDGGGGGDDNVEWFQEWDYDVYPSDTINIGYDPDTECDCDVDIEVYVDIFDNQTGDYVDSLYDDHTIYNGEEDWFVQDWTAYYEGTYDFRVELYDQEYGHEEDSFWIYDVYLSSDGGGGGGDDNGVGHIGIIDDFDEDDYVNDYIGGVLEDDDFKEDAYFEIYDEDNNLVDSGNPNYYGILFVSSNLTEGWYHQYVYYEEGDARLQSGPFYSYGDSEDFDVVNVDNIVVDDDELAVYDDVGFIAHQGDASEENGVEGVGIEIYKYNHSTEEWDFHAYVETNETGEAWLYNEPCGEYEWYASIEDEKGYYEVWAHCDDDNGGGGGDDDGIGHLGDIVDWDEDDGYVNDYIGAVTEDGDFRYEAYFEIYDENDNLVDAGQAADGIFVSENLDPGDYYHYIYYDEGAEDAIHYGIFYSYGESSGNTSGIINVDMAVIEDSDGDGEPNLFCDEGPCDDAFFKAHEGNWENGISDVVIEIYKYDSGTGETEHYDTVYTNDSGEAVSYDNPCGEYVWNATYYDDEIDKGYYQVWAGCDGTGGGGDYDEWFYNWDYDVDQANPDTITIGYDPDTECDCTVDIEVYVDIFDNQTGDYVDSLYDDYTIYNGEEDWFVQDWTAYYEGTYDFHVYLYDQEYGHDEDDFWIYDVYLGGGEDYDEWIHAWIYYVPTGDDGNNNWNEIVVGYDPNTECDCDVDVEVYVEVYDENGNLAADSQSSHTINGDQEDWFLQEISMNIEPGEYDFFVTMYDEDGNHEEDKSFSLIMSDEWLDYDWAVEDGNVKIDLQGNTNYDGEIDTYYEVNVYRWNEDENDWEEIDSLSEDATISSGSPAPLHFEWEAEESGDYRFVVYMFDEMGQEDSFDFMEEINLNQAPVIEDLNVDHLFEGQLFNFEVDAFDADDDELEYTWDMGDGSSKKEGDSVRYGYQDDGVYTVTVWVSDGELTTDKEFQIVVENMAPALEVSFVDEADEGSELSFSAQVHDVASDDVTVTWTFADGSRVVGTFAQYTFRDNGEYLVVVVAEDEDGGTTMQQLLVTINNVAPTFTQFVMPSGGEEGEALDFMVSATDPGDDTITYTFDFGDDTAIMMTPDGNISHKFADGDTFTIVICAQDEDGGENCRTETLPVSILEQMEEEGLLPGFGVLGALSALGVIGILRRRTH